MQDAKDIDTDAVAMKTFVKLLQHNTVAIVKMCTWFSAI